MTILNANPQNKGQRLDLFLVENLEGISRSRAQNLIENSLVINQKTKEAVLSSSYKIKGLEEFLITIPEIKESNLDAKDIKINIIWEDEVMMVIDKQAGLTTHPGNDRQNDTLVNALLFHRKDNLSGINGVLRPGIVHRLDKDTSGLMVVAKNDLAHTNLSEQIQNRTLKRKYLAICYGTPKPLSGAIEKNIGRSKINRLKMVVSKTGGKFAKTYYQVKEIFHNGLLSLVECQLETGRTHQIRVHLSAISHSLVGDQTYGNRKKALKGIDPELKDFLNNFPRQALHSYQISFLHPVTKKEMSFASEFPEDLKELVEKLRK